MSLLVLLLTGAIAYYLARRFGANGTGAQLGLARSASRVTAAYTVALAPVPESEIPLPVFERHAQERYFVGILPSGEKVYFGVKQGNGYVEVWARTRRKGEKGGVFTGPHRNFSFLPPNRWTYASAPPGTADIRPMIQWLENEGLN